MIKKVFIVFSIIILTGLVYSEANKRTKPSYSMDPPYVKVGEKIIEVEVADEINEHWLGLSHRKSLPEDTGMLFVFEKKQERSFWMKDMNFPLDIIWINDDRVVKIDKDCKAEGGYPKIKHNSIYPVNFVLEANAGFANMNDIKIGDKLMAVINQ